MEPLIDEKDPTIFRCPFCTFSVRHKQRMLGHIKNHSKPNRYGCPYCPFETYSRCSAKNHINVKHSKIRKFNQCPYCEYRTSYSIKLHIDKNHKKGVMLKCFLCEFSSVDTFEVMEHVNVEHSDEKFYNCWNCTYEAPSLIEINNHVQKKHKVQEVECKQCDIILKQNTLAEHDYTNEIQDITLNCEKCERKKFTALLYGTATT